MRRNTFIGIGGFGFLVWKCVKLAGPGEASKMHIAGYLCGN